MVKRKVVETTEKYDENGKLVGKIIKEESWEEEDLECPEADISKRAIWTTGHGYPTVGVGKATWAGAPRTICEAKDTHAIGVPNTDGYKEGTPTAFAAPGTVTPHAVGLHELGIYQVDRCQEGTPTAFSGAVVSSHASESAAEANESSHGCHCGGECHHAEGHRP